ncbi:hypothetical protein Skr01_58120 [Sphaerisporangium krabiense]|uniref:HPP transmembrane region domain-containing protein n=1 Tax=Sphaerisporangium krabiense TaxID=763782 RepID=A0A7W9DS85_9ACTN|nr:HPP family protein [Sphaerisporangium krabiense]MBB5629422.1 hypothetical protein [Sphaerisporangium krabiense]GII65727.1 hypothetical protein Skr01_58120 [Sphaerisporangium krabiense]
MTSATGPGGPLPPAPAGESRWHRALVTAAQAAVCIAVPAVVAWVSGQPFVFPSLGPTVFLALTSASTPAASPRNTVAGHLISASAGYAALALTGLTRAVPDLSHPNGHRVAAVAIALALTAGGMLLGDLPHPPGGATTLIVALGLLRTPSQLTILMAAVVTTTGVLVTVNRLSGRSYPLWGPAGPSLAGPWKPFARRTGGRRGERAAASERMCREAARCLAGAMTSAVWPVAHVRVARLLGRGDTRREDAVAARLTASRASLLETGDPVATAAHWTADFRALLTRDPAAARTLSAFTDTITYLLRKVGRPE